METKGILFDVYGTLIDIETDESMEEIYRGIAHFLTYRGLHLHRGDVRDQYYSIMKEQKAKSIEEFPEIDVKAIWREFLKRQGVRSAVFRKNLGLVLAQLYRGISRKHLSLYPDVIRVLNTLKETYSLALVSDSQPCFAYAELKATGLEGYFSPVVISANYGFRKPDPRMFEMALQTMKLEKDQVVFVGNDMYHDVHGAKRFGIRAIHFASNQGDHSFRGSEPDYRVAHFGEIPDAIECLSRKASDREV